MQRARLVLGLFVPGLVLGGFLGLAGNVWVVFYLKYLNIEPWMFDLSFSLVTLGLGATCAFLIVVQLFRGVETLGVKGGIGVEKGYRVSIPERFARQLDIGPGDRIGFAVDQDRLVLEKRE